LLKARGYAEGTIDRQSTQFDLFLRYLKARKISDCRKVTSQVIFDYWEMITAQALTNDSKINKIRPVKQFFTYLTESHKLLINPAEEISWTCKDNAKIGIVLTLEEIKELFSQPDLSIPIQYRDRTMMEVMYSSAIRLNELLCLTIYDVDLTEEVLYINKGKGGKDRVVPLGKRATGYLKKYMETVRPRYARRHPNGKTLFLNHFGKPLHRQGLCTRLRRYRAKAGIEKRIYPHTFRRTCATHMLQQGADIRYIQKLLGHKKLSTTQKYTKVRPIDVKRIHEMTHPGVSDEN
ncbi:MAG: tyrosine-type recombinase/integrase, partial [bacterium]|nr:tyrosine-type recombinase/integrase [bacterium]